MGIKKSFHALKRGVGERRNQRGVTIDVGDGHFRLNEVNFPECPGKDAVHVVEEQTKGRHREAGTEHTEHQSGNAREDHGERAALDTDDRTAGVHRVHLSV